MIKVHDEVSGLLLTARRTEHFEFLLQTVNDILRIKEAQEFQVGITATPMSRRRAYARWCRGAEATFGGFVLLDWGRTAEQILETERWLFHRLEGHRKYAKTSTRRYYPSAARHLGQQVIYLAWWSW